MKSSGRELIGATEKHNYLQAVLGSLLMVSLFTGCGSTASTMPKEDLARFTQVPAIRTVHYSPAMSFNVTTPGKALAQAKTAQNPAPHGAGEREVLTDQANWRLNGAYHCSFFFDENTLAQANGAMENVACQSATAATKSARHEKPYCPKNGF